MFVVLPVLLLSFKTRTRQAIINLESEHQLTLLCLKVPRAQSRQVVPVSDSPAFFSTNVKYLIQRACVTC